MLGKILVSTLAASTIIGASMMATPATARDGRNGAFAAGAAAGVVGGALLARPSYGYAEPRRVYVEPEQDCFMRREKIWDGDGYRIRRVEVCR